MRHYKVVILIYLPIIFFSCRTSVSKIDASTYSDFQTKGDEITALAQATLLGNVGKAMQEGGSVYAVEFCNLKATSIVDSLDALNGCIISRLSEKNRNSDNNPKNKTDKKIIQLMANENIQDTLVQSDNVLTYYKPIKIGIETCLKCHGNPNSDIDSKTLQKIRQLYPNDLATGYELNDFRGIWKVEFSIIDL